MGVGQIQLRQQFGKLEKKNAAQVPIHISTTTTEWESVEKQLICNLWHFSINGVISHVWHICHEPHFTGVNQSPISLLMFKKKKSSPWVGVCIQYSLAT